MITHEALKAANYNKLEIIKSGGSITNRWWAVREAKGLGRLSRDRRPPEFMANLEALLATAPRIPVKVVKRDVPYDDYGTNRPGRRYRGGGVSAHVQELLAVLLDGFKVVRLGETYDSPHAGLDEETVQVLVMPMRKLVKVRP